jgi:hypothetical protein
MQKLIDKREMGAKKSDSVEVDLILEKKSFPFQHD